MAKSKATIRGRIQITINGKASEVLILGGTKNSYTISGLKFSRDTKRGTVLADRVNISLPSKDLPVPTKRWIAQKLVSLGASFDEAEAALTNLQFFLRNSLKI